MLRINGMVLTLPALLLTVTSVAAQMDQPPYRLGLVLDSSVDQRTGDQVLSVATEAFFFSRRFTMVERRQLPRIFTENDQKAFLSKSDQAFPELIGLDLLGFVGYTVESRRLDDGNSVATPMIEVRLVDVKTGKILGTISSQRAGSPPAATLRDVRHSLFESVREAFPPFGYVIKVTCKEVVVDLGSDDGLKEGDVLQVVREGEQIIHPVTGQPIPAEWVTIGQLKVVSVFPHRSACWLQWPEAVPPGSLVFLKEDLSL